MIFCPYVPLVGLWWCACSSMISPIYKWIIYCFPKFQGFLVYFGHKSYGIHLLKMPPFHKISCIVLLLTISWLYLCAAFMWLCVLVLFQSWSLSLQSVSKSGITSPLTLFFGSSPCHLSGLLHLNCIYFPSHQDQTRILMYRLQVNRVLFDSFDKIPWQEKVKGEQIV